VFFAEAEDEEGRERWRRMGNVTSMGIGRGELLEQMLQYDLLEDAGRTEREFIEARLRAVTKTPGWRVFEVVATLDRSAWRDVYDAWRSANVRRSGGASAEAVVAAQQLVKATAQVLPEAEREPFEGLVRLMWPSLVREGVALSETQATCWSEWLAEGSERLAEGFEQGLYARLVRFVEDDGADPDAGLSTLERLYGSAMVHGLLRMLREERERP
jgi:hypothetical protein